MLIAIKKELNPIIEQVKSVIPQGKQLLEIPGLEYLHPEFLQVDATIDKEGERTPLSIIGTRIKTDKENSIRDDRGKRPGRVSQMKLLW